MIQAIQVLRFHLLELEKVISLFNIFFLFYQQRRRVDCCCVVAIWIHWVYIMPRALLRPAIYQASLY